MSNFQSLTHWLGCQFLPGVRAVRIYLLPILLIQFCAIALVVAYYHVPAVASWCEWVGNLRKSAGIFFVVGGIIFAGVVIPEISKLLTGRLETRERSRDNVDSLFWLCVFFAGSGLIVDTFYKIQTNIFGSGTDVQTVVIKILVDQFLFTPLVGQTYGILFFLWLEERRDYARWLARISVRLVVGRILKVAFPGWVYWIPMVACIYSLPSALQYPFFLLAMACWSLVFVAIARSFASEQRLAEPLNPEQLTSCGYETQTHK